MAQITQRRKRAVNKVSLILVIICMLSLVGCSHNSINYSDGIGFETTFRPDSGNFGFTFRYGKILSAVLRENSAIEMNGTNNVNSNSNTNVNTDGNVKINIGKQITGYYVDALKAGANQEKLNEYLESDKK